MNHPHNIILDFASRLGLFGLLAGGWLLWVVSRTLGRLLKQVTAVWQPLVIGLSGAVIDMVVHGLVDHSFFLVDLAFAFYLIVALTVWLQEQMGTEA